MKVCVITDNSYIYNEFVNLVGDKIDKYDFFYSSFNKDFLEKYKESKSFLPIKLKECSEDFFSNYDLFISLHCKQLFPDEMVNNHRCINVHPGLNPFNRGWFPQAFSIINGKPIGVTIHEIDTDLDHGPIIYQKELDINSWETSYDVYNRILQTEIDLIREHLQDLVSGNYTSHEMPSEGNINYKKDFDELCKLDMYSVGTLSEHINLLRALTFKGYDNAYFVDSDGKKVFVSVNLKSTSTNKQE